MQRLVLSFVLVLTAACDRVPGPGDDCKPTDIRCVDPKTELACQGGKFMAAPCKGPLGCKEDGKHLFCDITGNAEGDPCSTDEEGSARCVGEAQRITCRGGKYTIDFCRGDDGCKGGGSVKCDQSKGHVGDPCHGTSSACSTDGLSVLSCTSDRLQISAQCPGEGHCSVANHQIDCDLGKKDEGKKKAPP